MNFDQSDWIITLLMVVLGVSVLIAIAIIAKIFANDARESKAKAARLTKARTAQLTVEEKNGAAQKPQAPTKPWAKAAEGSDHKDDVAEDDNLVAAAEVYLTYELKEQAIISLEKHLFKNPTDKKALDLLKKAEASSQNNSD